MDRAWTTTPADDPIVATAIHHGHDLREEIAARSALPEPDRLREEDPHTGLLTDVSDGRVVVHRSRFEVDLNRPRDRAVYREPADAWGLEVWRDPPLPEEQTGRSLEIYDAFYRELETMLAGLERTFGAFVVLDLHSYNHRRAGPGAPPEDPAENPQVNIGTGSLARERWAGLVDRFVEDLAGNEVAGRPLDVRENVRFRGGHLAAWVHERFPGSGCTLAIELRKSFMDEWTGTVEDAHLSELRSALATTIPGLREELRAR